MISLEGYLARHPDYPNKDYLFTRWLKILEKEMGEEYNGKRQTAQGATR